MVTVLNDFLLICIKVYITNKISFVSEKVKFHAPVNPNLSLLCQDDGASHSTPFSGDDLEVWEMVFFLQ